MYCDYNYPNTSTQAHNLHKILNHLHTLSLVQVSAITHHPQGDINTKEYKINTSNLHIQC
jgi:hypothetical protein